MSTRRTPAKKAKQAKEPRRSVAELQEECDELNRLFDLQRKRSVEATRAWRKAHPGNDDVSPDLGTLLTWLLEECGEIRPMVEEIKTATKTMDAARAEIETLRAEIAWTRQAALGGLHIALGYLHRQGLHERTPAGAAVARAIIEVGGVDADGLMFNPDAAGVFQLVPARFIAAEHAWKSAGTPHWVPVPRDDDTLGFKLAE